MNDYFLTLLLSARGLMDAHLERRLTSLQWHSLVVEDTRYIMLGAGKAFRPALAFFSFEQMIGPVPQFPDFLLDCALAVEMIHSYSLIHDDLPAMDNDDYRRGKMTLHKKHNEARAILAGDALLNGAFEVLAMSAGSAEQIVSALGILAQASGARGLISGQMRDILETGEGLGYQQNLEGLSQVHREKTGALIAASLELGLVAARAPKSVQQQCRIWGESLGLLFQVVDDLLDATQSSEVLGKSAGKDAAAGKRTYVTLLGIAGARAFANELHTKLRAEAGFFTDMAKVDSLLKLIMERTN